MTGLDPFRDRIIEIATVVTDERLEILAKGPVLAIHQPEHVLAAMDAWNREQHGRSGLLARVPGRAHATSNGRDRDPDLPGAVRPDQKSPLCGNNICQDRRFLARCMPRLEAYFHYRNLDVNQPQDPGPTLGAPGGRILRQGRCPPGPREISRVHRGAAPLSGAPAAGLTLEGPGDVLAPVTSGGSGLRAGPRCRHDGRGKGPLPSATARLRSQARIRSGGWPNPRCVPETRIRSRRRSSKVARSSP